MILIVGALTFFPALALGPIVEHFLMNAGIASHEPGAAVVMPDVLTTTAPPEAPGGAPADAPHGWRRGRPGMSDLIGPAVRESFVKLDPRHLARNPVMFVVEVGSVITTVALRRRLTRSGTPLSSSASIAVWLWFTVLFANFAEAMAEGRGKAQADTLRKHQDRDAGQASSVRRRR